jgi:hypothetical protein
MELFVWVFECHWDVILFVCLFVFGFLRQGFSVQPRLSWNLLWLVSNSEICLPLPLVPFLLLIYLPSQQWSIFYLPCFVVTPEYLFTCEDFEF